MLVLLSSKTGNNVINYEVLAGCLLSHLFLFECLCVCVRACARVCMYVVHRSNNIIA